ncbi:condensation domain-containing protein [Micromonospora rifamycinica]|uniref:Condensation domain-containing protein n=1 Tax=Micromonospora rifamycinica TaxID=291594 RepID=A0A109IMB5_9ACTN|nr:condensation domain-containing protein [Micromonospora rifamycinica]KWV33159.1 condensation protein [Micromonospora rifamycinica]SCG51217.1 Condensation domain-containing protein [Micromonospora rifamycinica]
MFAETAEAQVLVPFAGPGAGTAPLTWGQLAIMQDMRETGWTHNVSGAHPVPAGVTVAQLAAQLGDLMSRYPALRMRLGTDDRGEPCQVVSADGEIALDVLDVPDDADPADVAKFAYELGHARLLTHYDLYRDWSVRMAVVRHRGVPVHRVLTLDHLVVDGTATALLMADLGLVDLAARRTPDPRTVDLLDLGRRERTPPLRRVSDRAVRHWETHLRAIPPSTFGEVTNPAGRHGRRFWHGRFSSPAAHLAVRAIARRTRTDTSRVLLAVIAVAVGRATGVSPLTAKLIVGNRFRPGFAEAIAPLSQNGVLTVDAADTTVDEVVTRARRASVAAGMYAYYDPVQLAETSARLDDERGYPARVTLRINDRRVVTRQAADDAARAGEVTPEQIRRKAVETFLVWDGTLDHLPEQAFITVEDHPDTIFLQVIFDLGCFTEAQAEALLRGVEEVAVEAAFDPTAPTRVTG